jgi:DNA (cytosine-5)-methyltransferase 1
LEDERRRPDPTVGHVAESEVLRLRARGALAPLAARFRLVDVFCGAGGFSLGFAGGFGHGFEPVWAIDHDPVAAETYAANLGPHYIVGDIHSVLNDPSISVPRADVVIGGSPCQGYSALNRCHVGDMRRELWRPFLDVVIRSDARVFVLENVPQFLASDEYPAMFEEATGRGFRVASAILCAADYGVPQTRRRAFVVGSRIGDPAAEFPPRRTHCDPAKAARPNGDSLPIAEPWRTVRDAIGDLPDSRGTRIRDEEPPLDLHFGRCPTDRSLRRYRAIPEEGMGRFDLLRRAPDLVPRCWARKASGTTDVLGRMWWDRPACTIRTEFFKPEKGRYLHPVQHRPITHREAARLQGFPDTFRFRGIEGRRGAADRERGTASARGAHRRRRVLPARGRGRRCVAGAWPDPRIGTRARAARGGTHVAGVRVTRDSFSGRRVV